MLTWRTNDFVAIGVPLVVADGTHRVICIRYARLKVLADEDLQNRRRQFDRWRRWDEGQDMLSCRTDLVCPSSGRSHGGLLASGDYRRLFGFWFLGVVCRFLV
jgi:hypothetical protein